MKEFFILICLISPLLFSCNNSPQQDSPEVIVSSDDNADTSPKLEKEFTIELVGNKQKNPLRNRILQSKTNEIIKKSFLQEMYIRDVVKVVNDSLLFQIPFDIHSQDCGTKDCYQTDVSFGFSLGNKLQFPQQMNFNSHENGSCIDMESKSAGQLSLVNQTDNHVIYHSKEQETTLVLFKSDKVSGNLAFLFEGIDLADINDKSIYTMLKNYNEEDEDAILPYMSWVLSTSEYENFSN